MNLSGVYEGNRVNQKYFYKLKNIISLHDNIHIHQLLDFF